MVHQVNYHGYDTLRFYARRVAFRQVFLNLLKTFININMLLVFGTGVRDWSMFDDRIGNA